MSTQTGERCLPEDVTANDEPKFAPRHCGSSIVDGWHVDSIDRKAIFMRRTSKSNRSNENKISYRRSAVRWLPAGLRVCSSQRDARSLLAASHG
jgi:hypothetical protein